MMNTVTPIGNSDTPKGRKRETWKLGVELVFVAWVVAINVLYYNQFKASVLRQVGRLLHR